MSRCLLTNFLQWDFTFLRDESSIHTFYLVDSEISYEHSYFISRYQLTQTVHQVNEDRSWGNTTPAYKTCFTFDAELDLVFRSVTTYLTILKYICIYILKLKLPTFFCYTLSFTQRMNKLFNLLENFSGKEKKNNKTIWKKQWESSLSKY